MKVEKTYIKRAKDKEILTHILGYIMSDTDSSREIEFAKVIEESSDGEITENEFYDWISEFDINDYIK